MSERCVKQFSLNVAAAYRAGVGEISGTAPEGKNSVLQTRCDVNGCPFEARLTITVMDGELIEVDNDSSGSCEEEDGYSNQRWDE